MPPLKQYTSSMYCIRQPLWLLFFGGQVQTYTLYIPHQDSCYNIIAKVFGCTSVCIVALQDSSKQPLVAVYFANSYFFTTLICAEYAFVRSESDIANTISRRKTLNGLFFLVVKYVCNTYMLSSSCFNKQFILKCAVPIPGLRQCGGIIYAGAIMI